MLTGKAALVLSGIDDMTCLLVSDERRRRTRAYHVLCGKRPLDCSSLEGQSSFDAGDVQHSLTVLRVASGDKHAFLRW